MSSLPAIADSPIQSTYRCARLILLVIWVVILLPAAWWWLFASMRSGPPAGNQFMAWFTAILAVTFVALLLFAAVTALMDLRQWARWLLVFGVILAQCLLLTTAELVAFADYRW